MTSTQQLLSWLFPIGSLLAGMMLVTFARRRILVSAVIVAIAATVLAVPFDRHPPIFIELGNTIVAFVFALGGGALGSRLQRRVVR